MKANYEITYSLDIQGEACPMPAVATLEALPQLKKGEVLEVLCDCPQAINSIPVDAKNRGFEVLSIEQDGPTLRFIIKKP
ncbi:sulfurtransferase-like selenium metabolism protein YedF [Campylobacter sp.]|uniref:sulfurtransferase-like selenium metabolism protein YedF n=1 Tax=Campylobacter sp. TaxID=205 RepID=UPI002A750F76|nr:sulfurtransferase-like selenium metabolism protein YedF [Campylobacter sp.]MDD7323233.1 sulfurtransferase-like selenium metabolism protein YedF [Campylobacteraceae bacterium]MDY2817420.1 sulfurtransferase-like selenium metabolism protein YedF [Campylobacter lanienae]MCI6564586.1 sulfurtransferase-like selenium metabolism protein YedF [Campylobacter sp.]MCI6579508.1 sulfurtransferase-like selenium metabolism protein YedF [Campylobacter sp.]MCI6661331.1 sulfurtransferase-like selenium metabol